MWESEAPPQYPAREAGAGGKREEFQQYSAANFMHEEQESFYQLSPDSANFQPMHDKASPPPSGNAFGTRPPF